MKKRLAAALLLAPALATADVARLEAYVTRTQISDAGRWGGCMAMLDREVAETGLDCPLRWVSFSCTGDFTSQNTAYRMMETAQIAQLSNQFVSLYVDDSKKHNGICYANRIVSPGFGSPR